jgi:hypothetical protein
MKIGTRVGASAELVVINCDAMGKRCACQCSACGTTMVWSAEAVATARCGCEPMSRLEREALRANRQAAEAHRQHDWRPGR